MGQTLGRPDLVYCTMTVGPTSADRTRSTMAGDTDAFALITLQRPSFTSEPSTAPAQLITQASVDQNSLHVRRASCPALGYTKVADYLNSISHIRSRKRGSIDRQSYRATTVYSNEHTRISCHGRLACSLLELTDIIDVICEVSPYGINT